MSITQPVLMMGIASVLLLVLFGIPARRVQLVPTGLLQNLTGALIEFLYKDLAIETIGEEGRHWFPFLATLFLFILTCNLLGLVPGGFTATSNINVTATLALVVFLTVQGTGIRRHGLAGYLKGLVPHGVPIFIAIVMFPIEIVGQLAKPFSLAVRLFANMFAGHAIILVFLGLIILSESFFVAPLPALGVVLMSGMEIGFSFIQAYIFTILSAMYISAAIHQEH